MLARNLDRSIQTCSCDCRVDASALEKRVLLHLPRFSFEALRDGRTVRAEVLRHARLAAKRMDESRPLLEYPGLPPLRRADFHVTAVETGMARLIEERFHYLETARCGEHYGLFHRDRPGIPAAMVTVSELDVEHLRARAPHGAGGIVSRMYAFPWAPRNSISALLGAIGRETGKLLFTYVNPNLGFTGASYRAANWRRDGEKSITYRYQGDRYVTAREAYAAGPVGIRQSPFALEPLEIWRND